MGIVATNAASVWRDWTLDGVATSGAWEPNKSEIRAWCALVAGSLDSLQAGQVGGALAFDTKASLDAALAYPANAMAFVFADSTPINNGTYRKSGASGAGSWSKVSGLIYGPLPSFSVTAQFTTNPLAGAVTIDASTPVAPILNFVIPRGTQIYATSGAPSNAVGLNGDFALDPATYAFYGPKASGGWPAPSLTAQAAAAQVAADKATVAADKAIVAADKGIVAADRVQTGLDRIAAANSAALAAGVAVGSAYTKAPVRTVATSNITLSGTQTINGVALGVGDRVLAVGQSTASQNGIYLVAAGAWSRAADADTAGEITGAIVLVTGGNYRGYLFRLVTEGITLGTTPLVWMASEAPSSAAAFHWYVDSVAGNDSNAGTIAAPFATLAKLATVAAPGDYIWLKRGSVFREQFALMDRWTVRAYGRSGPKPIVSGADVLANASFTLESGNVYKISLPSIPTTNNPHAGVNADKPLMVWENNVRLGESTVLRTSIADVQANPGSWWWDNAAKILYIHATGGSNIITNNRLYEVSTRSLAIHGGDRVYAENIIGEKAGIVNLAGQQGYGILAYASGHYFRCEGRYAWNHAIGVANAIDADDLVFERCYAFDCERNTIVTPPTLFIAYKAGSRPSRVIFKDCKAKQPTIFSGSYQEIAYFAHGSRCICEYQGRNYAENTYYGYQLVNDGQDGSFNIVNGKLAGRNHAIGVYVRYGTHVLDVELQGCSVFGAQFIDVSSTISPADCVLTGKMIDCVNAINAQVFFGTPMRIIMRDMIIARSTAPVSHTDGAGVQCSALATVDVTRCVFFNIGTVFNGVGTNNPIGVSNNNRFNGFVRMYSSTSLTPTFSTSFSDWQTASGQDANSVTTAPTFAYNDLVVFEPAA